MTQEFYALSNDRRASAVRRYLAQFLPNRISGYSEYPVPENSDAPQHLLRTESEILEYLERHPNEPYGLYWRDAGTSPTLAMAFYTCDGHVIFGLAADTPQPTTTLKALADSVGARYSMLGWEQRPPETAREFIALCSA